MRLPFPCPCPCCCDYQGPFHPIANVFVLSIAAIVFLVGRHYFSLTVSFLLSPSVRNVFTVVLANCPAVSSSCCPLCCLRPLSLPDRVVIVPLLAGCVHKSYEILIRSSRHHQGDRDTIQEAAAAGGVTRIYVTYLQRLNTLCRVTLSRSLHPLGLSVCLSVCQYVC